MNLYSLLNALEDLESEMALMYRDFEQRFQGDEEACNVFRQLYRDELEHKNIVTYILRLVMQNPKEFSDVDESPGDILEMTEGVKKIRLGKENLGLVEAILLAENLESSAVEHHFRTAAVKANPQLAEMCKNLGRADAVHVRTLQDLMKLKNLPSIPERSRNRE